MDRGEYLFSTFPYQQKFDVFLSDSKITPPYISYVLEPYSKLLPLSQNVRHLRLVQSQRLLTLTKFKPKKTSTILNQYQ